MATSFRVLFTFIERANGYWRDGQYISNRTVGVPKQILASVQSASAGDRNAIEALPYGRRAAQYLKVYTDEPLNPVSQEPGGNPGDLLIFDGRQWLIIGETNFTMLQRTRRNTRVSHFRYYAAETIENETEAYEKVP